MKRLWIFIPIVTAGIIAIAAFSAMGNSMVCSKHDLGCLNQRAFGSEVGPMQGTAFNDYGEVCVYCHTPHNADSIAPLWNRQSNPNPSDYKVYSSPNFDSKNLGPDGISLACLSCHDGTVAVDAVLNQPRVREIVDTGVHYKMKPGGSSAGGDACGKCHSRTSGAYGGLSGAHDATLKYLETDLTNDHPFSITFPTYETDPGFNQPSIPSKAG
ncbi:MAG: hypothetical protein PH343_06380, partial [Nitrospira sp.]|nr:hypothetical protein [Nitrospira sp.]